jgi:quercetin dioxygenase-like cupin family protein
LWTADGCRIDLEKNQMSSKEIMPVSIKETELISPEAGLSRQVLAYNEKLMLVRNLMEKGWIGLRHRHPHEQLVYVIRGHIQFTGGEGTFNARTGDSFVVPGGVEHQARALEESEVLDVFYPFREDYAPR